MAPKKKIEVWPFDTVWEYRKAFTEQVDENGNKVRPSVTFYVRRADGETPLSWPSIMWKFGSGLTDWPNPMAWNQRPSDQLKNIRFENGYFTTNDPEQIWFLDHYHTGGVYEDPKRDISTNYPGENKFIADISRTDPNAQKEKVITEIQERIVEKTIFPRVILEAMDPAQLMAICGSLSIDMTNVEQTVGSLVKHMEDKWFVQW